MTKWICMSGSCRTSCKCETGSGICDPEKCLLDDREPCWKRDCTTEERSSAVFDAFAGVDNRVCHLEKKVQELITAGQGQMKRIQELERKFNKHHHGVSFIESDTITTTEYRV
jgi:hypothetical protein